MRRARGYVPGAFDAGLATLVPLLLFMDPDLAARVGGILGEEIGSWEQVAARRRSAGDTPCLHYFTALAIVELGFELFAAEGSRLHPLSSILIPDGAITVQALKPGVPLDQAITQAENKGPTTKPAG